MLWTKIKTMAAVFVALSLLAAGTSWLTLQPSATAQTQADPASEKIEAAAEEPITVQMMPPVVVKTVPQAGATDIDPANTREIRVTFSKKMTDQSWSWSQISDETFPKVNGKPHYDEDRRTCILPVQLEAGQTYVLWLNSAKFQNFKDAEGRPAVPYLLVFQTKKGR